MNCQYHVPIKKKKNAVLSTNCTDINQYNWLCLIQKLKSFLIKSDEKCLKECWVSNIICRQAIEGKQNRLHKFEISGGCGFLVDKRNASKILRGHFMSVSSKAGVKSFFSTKLFYSTDISLHALYVWLCFLYISMHTPNQPVEPRWHFSLTHAWPGSKMNFNRRICDIWSELNHRWFSLIFP